MHSLKPLVAISKVHLFGEGKPVVFEEIFMNCHNTIVLLNDMNMIDLALFDEK
jgi:hypothetical protein